MTEILACQRCFYDQEEDRQTKRQRHGLPVVLADRTMLLVREHDSVEFMWICELCQKPGEAIHLIECR